ncbi:glycoside hydrolase family 104 protein [Polaromonas sp. YR568]|uniref:glycoside hydrolase family 24 protein n=1 Tax=Polaromonas sp. YR568 TaxID=1855301 RepID=UPI0031380369
MNLTLAAATVITAAVFIGVRRAQGGAVLPDFTDYTSDTFTDYAPDESTDQLATPFEEIFVNLNPTTYIPAAVPADVAAQNEKAFLDMLAYAEIGHTGPDGYRTLFGGKLFNSFADHPRVFTPFTNGRGERLMTSAAGRYQFLSRTWDALQRRLQLPDFGPESQDRAALELVRERGALNDVRAGRLQAAVAKVAPIWASMPGAGYAQPEKKLTTLVAQYQAAGGNLEA